MKNMKKLLSAVGLLAVAVPVSLSVVACGSKPESINKNDLKEVIKNKTVLVNNIDNTEKTVLNKILELNSNLTNEDVEIKEGSFTPATTNEDGSVIIIAKSESKFTGEVNITLILDNKYDLEDGTISALYNWNNTLYAGTSNGNIWIINLDNNEKKKAFEINDGNISSLIVAKNGNLYAGTLNSNLWKINLEENKFDKIVEKLDSSGERMMAISSIIEDVEDDVLYVGTIFARVYKVDLSQEENKPLQFNFAGDNSSVQSNNSGFKR